MKNHLSRLFSLLLTVGGVLTSSPSITPAWAQCGIPGDPPPFTSAIHDLDEDASAWGVFCEKSPTFTVQNVSTPSLDGESLECSITGGSEPYSNVHCFLHLIEEPEATYFVLKLSFFYTPTTTYASEDAIVQALEFTMNKWQDSLRYEWALQWRNVGIQSVDDGAPQWYYWDGDRPGSARWVRIQNLPFDHRLEANRWHTLTLEGHIEDGAAYYRRFEIKNQDYTLDHELNVTAPPVVPSPSEDVDRVSVAFQVDGNFESAPYQFFMDNVSLIRTRCVPDDRTLCLKDGRFRVRAEWQTAATGGPGFSMGLTNDTGYLWFFNPENVEIVIKVLDGCSINEHFWVFVSGLTNVGVEITVEDTETGNIQTYPSEPGTPFEVILDTTAFMTCP